MADPVQNSEIVAEPWVLLGQTIGRHDIVHHPRHQQGAHILGPDGKMSVYRGTDLEAVFRVFNLFKRNR